MTASTLQLLEDLMQDPACGWSAGVFGAIAEFTRDAGEPAERLEAPWIGWVTARGGIAVDSRQDGTVIAYESLSRRPGNWMQGLVLALPRQALPEGPSVLTALGPDSDALRAEDRDALLFDMGLGRPGFRFCVRTADPALQATLSAACGKSLLSDASEAMAAIKAESPARVAITPLGRVEVYQTIGSTSRGIPTPEGPHSHLLPKLLASGRSHDANIALPDEVCPLISLYPRHPLDSQGAFDGSSHAAFQALLQRYGGPGYLKAK
ncbi:MAG: hypothetical protein AAFY02_17115, partial [Pseudomonadota bacterium]